MKCISVIALVLTLAVAGLGQMTVVQNPTAAYTFDRCMDIGKDAIGQTFMLYWRVIQDPATKAGIVRFATETASIGWTAIGLSLDGSMNSGGKGSDVMLTWKDSQSTSVNVDDRWTGPTRQMPALDNSQDVTALGAALSGNPSPLLVSAFERAISTGDSLDRDITTEAPQWVIFALNDVSAPPSASQVPFHSLKGARLVNWSTDGANCQTKPALPAPSCPAADWSNFVTVNVRLAAAAPIAAAELAVYAEIAGVCVNRLMCDTCSTPGSVHQIKIASPAAGAGGKPALDAGSTLTWALNGAAQSSFTLAAPPVGAAATTTNIISSRTGNQNLVSWPHVDGATNYWVATFDATGATVGSVVVSDLETACPESKCRATYALPPGGQAGTLYTIVYTFNKVKDVVSEASVPVIVTRNF